MTSMANWWGVIFELVLFKQRGKIVCTMQVVTKTESDRSRIVLFFCALHFTALASLIVLLLVSAYTKRLTNFSKSLMILYVTGNCVPQADNNLRGSSDYSSRSNRASCLLHRSQSCCHTLLENGVEEWTQTLLHSTNNWFQLVYVCISNTGSLVSSEQQVLLGHNCPCLLYKARQLMCSYLTGSRYSIFFIFFLYIEHGQG